MNHKYNAELEKKSGKNRSEKRKRRSKKIFGDIACSWKKFPLLSSPRRTVRRSPLSKTSSACCESFQATYQQLFLVPLFTSSYTLFTASTQKEMARLDAAAPSARICFLESDLEGRKKSNFDFLLQMRSLSIDLSSVKMISCFAMPLPYCLLDEEKEKRCYCLGPTLQVLHGGYRCLSSSSSTMWHCVGKRQANTAGPANQARQLPWAWACP